jgi:hypothetical protein
MNYSMYFLCLLYSKNTDVVGFFQQDCFAYRFSELKLCGS